MKPLSSNVSFPPPLKVKFSKEIITKLLKINQWSLDLSEKLLEMKAQLLKSKSCQNPMELE